MKSLCVMRKPALAAVTLACLLALASCGGSGDSQGAPGGGQPEIVVPVEVKPVRQGEISERVELAGTVRSHQRVHLAAEIRGIVEEILVREGESFKKGDLLVRLDRRDFEIALQGAKAQLAQQKARLDDLLRGTRPEVIEQYEAAVKLNEASVRDSELNLQRTKTLFEENVRSQAQMDEAQYAYDRARAALAEAKARLEEARNGPTREEIAEARAAVQVQQSLVDQAKRQLEKTEIKAPFDGAVSRRMIDEGAFIEAGRQLMEIISTGDQEVYFDIPERLIGRIQPGDRVRLLSDSFPEFQLDLPITAILPAADDRSRNIPARCDLPPDTPLRPGMLVRVKLEVGRRTGVLIVPQDAVQNNNGMSFVYLAKEGQAEMIPVQTGLSTETEIEVAGELQPGDPVIVLGNEVIFPGAKIQIAGEGAPPRNPMAGEEQKG